jgi:hypothetical protein
MSWQELQPTKPSGKKMVPILVGASANSKNGRFSQWLALNFRDDLLGLQFLKAGQTVKVELGHGEHAACIKVSPGGLFVLGKPGGKNHSVGSVLRLPALPNQSPEKFSQTRLKYQIVGGV